MQTSPAFWHGHPAGIESPSPEEVLLRKILRNESSWKTQWIRKLRQNGALALNENTSPSYQPRDGYVFFGWRHRAIAF